MNLIDPVSVRQNNERSPKINIESGAFELLKTNMSTACSPILNDQSICKGKKKDSQIVYSDWSILLHGLLNSKVCFHQQSVSRRKLSSTFTILVLR